MKDDFPFQTYEQCLSFIDQLDVSIQKLGTSRIKKVMTFLKEPQNQVPAIHIAGTNGKGSVCAILQSILQAAGYRTGLFISPHLVDVKERIQLDGLMLSPFDFVEVAKSVYGAMVKTLPDKKDWLTYFEFINAMAFVAFARHKVDVAIVETGLGGRLDSTNIINSPHCTVITPISLDHQARLGNTLEAIAGEKAGILKEGCPVVTGFQQPEAMMIIQTMAHKLHTPLHKINTAPFEMGTIEEELGCVWRNILFPDQETMKFNLLGRYQANNLALSLEVLKIIEDDFPVPLPALRQGLNKVSWPGRFTYFPHKQLIIDGSHNIQGFESLLDTLRQDFPGHQIHWKLSLLKHRPLASITPLLQYENTRSVGFIDTSGLWGEYHPPSAFLPLCRDLDSVEIDMNTDNDTLMIRPASKIELTIVTGSLYSAGSILAQAALQKEEFTCP